MKFSDLVKLDAGQRLLYYRRKDGLKDGIDERNKKICKLNAVDFDQNYAVVVFPDKPIPSVLVHPENIHTVRKCHKCREITLATLTDAIAYIHDNQKGEIEVDHVVKEYCFECQHELWPPETMDAMLEASRANPRIY